MTWMLRHTDAVSIVGMQARPPAAQSVGTATVAVKSAQEGDM
jgi:hypothetical protein